MTLASAPRQGLDPVACGALAAYLTATEATRLADYAEAGEPRSAAMAQMPSHRRQHIAELVTRSGGDLRALVPVLRAVAGALGQGTRVEPVLTAPGNRVATGRLSGAAADLVRQARTSVVCSTYNFEHSSQLWHELSDAAARPDVSVRIYLDSEVSSNTSTQLAAAMRRARIFGTKRVDGRRVRNHAKFIAVDHRWLLVTSANFSMSAERFNLELGVSIDDVRLAQLVERQWASVEDALFEPVRSTDSDKR